MRRVLVDKGPRLSLRSNCCRSSRSRAGTSRSRSYSARKYRPTATWSSVNRASVRIEASGSSIPCEGFPMGSPIVWSGGPAGLPDEASVPLVRATASLLTCALSALSCRARKTVLTCCRCVTFPDSTYQEAESRFRSRSSEQFCPPISPWNFMDPKRGL